MIISMELKTYGVTNENFIKINTFWKSDPYRVYVLYMLGHRRTCPYDQAATD